MDHAAHEGHHEPAPLADAHHEGHAAGHDRHAGHSVAMFRDRFWLSLALTIPTVLLSPEVAGWIGYTIPTIPGIEYVPAILGTIIFLYGGLVFIRGAQGELADRKPGMMTLISLAIIVAFVTSWAGTLGFFEVEIWWELATLITIMLLGHWLEMRSIAQAQGALSALAALLPDTAERVVADGTEEVPIGALQLDDVVLVRPGARVPADGQVVDGMADVDESMITGESRAVPKQVGDKVIAGTVAAGGALRVRVTATGDATALSGIMRLVAQAQASASRAQALADRAAALLFYVALARRRDHARRLVAAGRPRGGAGSDGDRAGDRLPARPRPGDPAGHRDLHLARRPERAAGQGPPRPRASADPRHGRSSTRPGP